MSNVCAILTCAFAGQARFLGLWKHLANLVVDLDNTPDMQSVYEVLRKQYGDYWMRKPDAVLMKDSLLYVILPRLLPRYSPGTALITTDFLVADAAYKAVVVVPTMSSLEANFIHETKGRPAYPSPELQYAERHRQEVQSYAVSRELPIFSNFTDALRTLQISQDQVLHPEAYSPSPRLN